MPVVVVTDAVVHPGAMVVHAEHAALALPAVVRPWRLVGVAHSAVTWTARETFDFVSFICLKIWLLMKRERAERLECKRFKVDRAAHP